MAPESWALMCFFLFVCFLCCCCLKFSFGVYRASVSAPTLTPTVNTKAHSFSGRMAISLHGAFLDISDPESSCYKSSVTEVRTQLLLEVPRQPLRVHQAGGGRTWGCTALTGRKAGLWPQRSRTVSRRLVLAPCLLKSSAISEMKLTGGKRAIKI